MNFPLPWFWSLSPKPQINVLSPDFFSFLVLPPPPQQYRSNTGREWDLNLMTCVFSRFLARTFFFSWVFLDMRRAYLHYLAGRAKVKQLITIANGKLNGRLSRSDLRFHNG